MLRIPCVPIMIFFVELQVLQPECNRNAALGVTDARTLEIRHKFYFYDSKALKLELICSMII